jgi:hypothetical protein
MLGKRLVDVRRKHAVEVIGQPVFKIITKHPGFFFPPRAFFCSSRIARTSSFQI